MQKIKKLFFLLFDLCTMRGSETSPSHKVTFLKLGGLGDLVLTLDLIAKYTRQFPQNSYSFICDQRWVELAESCLGKEIQIVPLNLDLFNKSFSYRSSFYQELKNLTCEVLVSPTVSRNFWLEDAIASHIIARKKITLADDMVNKSWLSEIVSGLFYTDILPKIGSQEYGNIAFFFQKLGLKEVSKLPALLPPQLELPEALTSPYLLVTLGAGHPQRAWSIENFCSLIRRLSPTEQIVFTGNALPAEVEAIERLSKDFKVLNFLQKTSLPLLATLVNNADLIIGNESGVIHLAVAYQKKFICISNGNHYGRFHPYPGTEGVYVYPEGFLEKYQSSNVFRLKVSKQVSESVNTISVDRVLECLNNNREYQV